MVWVKEIGMMMMFVEYIMVLYNLFFEFFFKVMYWEWFFMFIKGYGIVCSYGKRVVFNFWDNKEFFEDIDGIVLSVFGLFFF